MTTAKEKEIVRLSKIGTFITYHTNNYAEINHNSATYRTADKVYKRLNVLWEEARAKGFAELNQFFDAEEWGQIEAWNSGSLKR